MSSHAAGHSAAPTAHRKQYVLVFLALFALTVLEVGIVYVPMSKTLMVAALLGLALAKAWMVGWFFMHLNHETSIMRLTVAIPMLFPALFAFILIAEGIYRLAWG